MPLCGAAWVSVSSHVLLLPGADRLTGFLGDALGHLPPPNCRCASLLTACRSQRAKDPQVAPFLPVQGALAASQTRVMATPKEMHQ